MSDFDSVLKKYMSKYKYKNPDLTKQDVSKALEHYRDLRPSSEKFVFNDGKSQHLVQLEGTIPVPYKGNTYNIPVQLWILDSHPYKPPMVFVRPTQTMHIKSGRYVDMNGTVDIPFLRDWRWPSSDLISLIEMLVSTFAEECPVFSKVPARPPQPNPSQMPQPSGYPQPTPPGGYPPVFPGPHAGSGYAPQHNFGPAAGGGFPLSTASFLTSQAPFQIPARFGGYGGSNPPYPAVSHSTAFAASQMTAASSIVAVPLASATGTVTEEHLRASLLSAVEDKVKRRLREFFTQAQAEMDVLKKTEEDLKQGKVKLEKIVKDLEEEKMTLDNNLLLMTRKDQEVKEALLKMQNNEKVDIDEAVITTAPLYRQLLDAFAEELAIEDAIFYLGEAFRKNRIELEVFLKKVRELSRRQFMQRALIQKCREKAGLPPLM